MVTVTTSGKRAVGMFALASFPQGGGGQTRTACNSAARHSDGRRQERECDEGINPDTRAVDLGEMHEGHMSTHGRQWEEILTGSIKKEG